MEITIEDLKKQLADREELKSKMESSYFQVIGQIQLLNQQIEMLLEKKEQKPEETK